MNVHNWMGHIHSPSNTEVCNIVEVRFKNSRKDFYRLPEGLEISEGDVVAVEGNPGHDIGIVTAAFQESSTAAAQCFTPPAAKNL